ncbi:MAG: autotransporter domain-containing protein [Pseudomonadota bacterium]
MAGATLNDGDTIIVTDDGEITVSGQIGEDVNGLFSAAQGVTLIHNGEINVTGDGATTFIDVSGIRLEGFDSVIESTGAITTTATGDGDARGFYIRSNSTTANVTNSGVITIQQAGDDAGGFRLDGDNATVTNSGVIVINQADDDASAFLINGANVTLMNSGDIIIEQTGDDARGFLINNANATVANSGDVTIEQAGDRASGFEIGNDSISVTNSGDIRVNADDDAWGFKIDGDNATVSNSGDVYVNSDNIAYGFEIDRAGNTVRNKGRLVVRGVNRIYGAHLDGERNTFVNSGTIIATSPMGEVYAVFVNGSGGNIVDLRAGSVLVGPVQFEDPNHTLTFGPGLNAVIVLESASQIPDTIIAPAGGVAVVGDTVVAVDPTGFLAGDQMQADLGRRILDAVDRGRQTPGRGQAQNQTQNQAQALKVLTFNAGAAAPNAIWGQTFYNRTDADATSDRGAYDSTLTGLVFGRYSEMLAGDLYIGGALGAQDGEQSFDADSWHLFAGYQTGATLGPVDVTGGLTVGYSHTDQDRTIADNTAATGLRELSAEYGAVFVMPMIGLSADLDPAKDAQLRPSLRLRAAAIFTEGYEEDGGALPLDVDARTTRIYELRAQAARIVNWGEVRGFGPFDGAGVTAGLRLGADFQHVDGDEVSSTVEGQALDFTLDEQQAVRPFIGADLTLARADGMALDAGVELGRPDHDSTDFNATLRATLPF